MGFGRAVGRVCLKPLLLILPAAPRVPRTQERSILEGRAERSERASAERGLRASGAGGRGAERHTVCGR